MVGELWGSVVVGGQGRMRGRAGLRGWQVARCAPFHSTPILAEHAPPSLLSSFFFPHFLQRRSGWPTDQLQAELLGLELAGQVARRPGGVFQRLFRA